MFMIFDLLIYDFRLMVEYMLSFVETQPERFLRSADQDPLFNNVTHQHVAGLNVIETFKAHATFKSLANLFNVFFFMTQ